MNWPAHGSNPHYLYQFLQQEMPEHVIDFSVNVNPFGTPDTIEKKWGTWFSAIEDYPDPLGDRLTTLLSKEEGISKQSILLGNGGAEIIQLLANLFRGQRVLLIQPTFSEYESMCQAYDCKISYLILEEPEWEIPLEELIHQVKENDVVFLCHPNNPTGITYSEDLLVEIIKACEESGCYLVVDEAFYDFLIHPRTLASYVKEYEHLIVIRSMTKMYAIAGLRLGYMVASPPVIDKVKRFQPHWSVNALALLAGEESILAKDYAAKTRSYFVKERERILPLLREAGYLLSDSEVNYYVLRDPQLGEQLSLFMYLLERGFVPRHTANYPGLNGRWLRFAIRTEEENNQLVEALIEWKNMD